MRSFIIFFLSQKIHKLKYQTNYLANRSGIFMQKHTCVNKLSIVVLQNILVKISDKKYFLILSLFAQMTSNLRLQVVKEKGLRRKRYHKFLQQLIIEQLEIKSELPVGQMTVLDNDKQTAPQPIHQPCQ